MAKQEWGDEIDHAFPIKLAANIAICFGGKLVPFEDAFKQAFKRAGGNLSIFKLFGMNFKSMEDVERRVVVSQVQAVKILPVAGSVLRMMTEKGLTIPQIVASKNIRIHSVWHVNAGKFVPQGLSISAAKVITVRSHY